MSYCAKEDLLERLPEDLLIELTDDADAGVVDESALARAVADADAEIDGHVAKRHSVPLSPVPDLIRKTSVEIAIYHLYSRRRGAPEEWRTRYEDNRRFLENFAKGIVSLGADDPSGAPSSSPAQAQSQTRVFSRETLGDF